MSGQPAQSLTTPGRGTKTADHLAHRARITTRIMRLSAASECLRNPIFNYP